MNVEVASVLAPRQFVLSAFGTAARAAVGVAPHLEVRLDAALAATVNGLSTWSAATVKVNFFEAGPFGVGMLVAGGVHHDASIDPRANPLSGFVTARLPLTLRTPYVVFTAVPRVTQVFGGALSTVPGADLGVAVPVGRYLEVVTEGSLTHAAGVTALGFVAGVAIKPFHNVTIPLVLAARPTAPDEPVRFGLLGVFAHVGFQF